MNRSDPKIVAGGIPFPAPRSGSDTWPWNDGRLSNSDAKDLPRVTIVTPSYNQADYLEESIRSVLLQGWGNLEYLVVDGGSTDGSLEIIKRYEPWIDWWVSEPDRGQAHAINKGFERATGSIVGWLNSDDVLYPGFIERRVAEFEGLPQVGLIYGDVDTGETLDRITGGMKGRALDFATMVRTLEVPVPQQSALWRQEVVKRLGGLEEKWWVVLDREYFLRIARHFEIRYEPGEVGFFRLHSECKSVSQELQWVDELPRLYGEFFADPELPADIAVLEDESMTAVDKTCATLLWRNRRFGRWASTVGRAALRSPRQFGWQFLIGGFVSKIRGAHRRLFRDRS